VWLHLSNRELMQTVLLSESGIGLERSEGEVDWFDWGQVQRIDRVLWPDVNLT
jgi:hypothetical protein